MKHCQMVPVKTSIEALQLIISSHHICHTLTVGALYRQRTGILYIGICFDVRDSGSTDVRERVHTHCSGL